MPLPEGFLDEVTRRLGLAEVIGKRVRLIRRGRQFLGLCPFHGEKTPSFHVYEDHFHCFGCGAHGSLFDFVMKSDGVGFREAVERLAAQAGLSMPQATPEARVRAQRRRSLQEAVEAAARYYQTMLRMPDGKPAMEYLRRRGLTDGAIDRFRLGYAPDGRSALKAALVRDGFAGEVMIEAGLMVQPEEPSRPAYDRFRNRVIFPICDLRGRVVGFGGRVLGSGEPKYLNSPETPLFHKGSLLYGIEQASAAARERGTMIVVEGYMDVIGLSEAGWQNAVAPLGTALTEDQLQTLWKMVPEPVLLFDPDAAGERAALRAAERALPLLKPGLSLRFALLRVDTRDDPDRVTGRYPPQFLRRALAEAAPLSEFLFRLETGGRVALPAEERAAVESRLRERTRSVGDPTVRAHMQQAFRDRLWRQSRAQAGSAGWRGATRGRAAAGRPDRKSPGSATGGGAAAKDIAGDMAAGIATSARVRAERTLAAIILNHPLFFHQVEDELGTLNFADTELDRLRQTLVALLSGTDAMERPDLVAALADRGLDEVLNDVLGDPHIRTHRLIAPGARVDDVMQTWTENLQTARRLTAITDLPAETSADAIITRLRSWSSGDGGPT
jgi:DNA primase